MPKFWCGYIFGHKMTTTATNMNKILVAIYFYNIIQKITYCVIIVIGGVNNMHVKTTIYQNRRPEFIYYENVKGLYCTNCKNRVPESTITSDGPIEPHSIEKLKCECGNTYVRNLTYNNSYSGTNIGTISYAHRNDMMTVSDSLYNDPDKISITHIEESFFPVKTKAGKHWLKRNPRYTRVVLNLKNGHSYFVDRRFGIIDNITYGKLQYWFRLEHDMEREIIKTLFERKGISIDVDSLYQGTISDLMKDIYLINRCPNLFVQEKQNNGFKHVLSNNYLNADKCPYKIMKHLPHELMSDADFVKFVIDRFKITNKMMINLLTNSPTNVSICVLLKTMRFNDDTVITKIANDMLSTPNHLFWRIIRPGDHIYVTSRQFKSYFTYLSKQIKDEATRYDHLVNTNKALNRLRSFNILKNDIKDWYSKKTNNKNN